MFMRRTTFIARDRKLIDALAGDVKHDGAELRRRHEHLPSHFDEASARLVAALGHIGPVLVRRDIRSAWNYQAQSRGYSRLSRRDGGISGLELETEFAPERSLAASWVWLHSKVRSLTNVEKIRTASKQMNPVIG
jgi:hypothetical protein